MDGEGNVSDLPAGSRFAAAHRFVAPIHGFEIGRGPKSFVFLPPPVAIVEAAEQRLVRACPLFAGGECNSLNPSAHYCTLARDRVLLQIDIKVAARTRVSAFLEGAGRLTRH
jgi:hypothetical protein